MFLISRPPSPCAAAYPEQSACEKSAFLRQASASSTRVSTQIKVFWPLCSQRWSAHPFFDGTLMIIHLSAREGPRLCLVRVLAQTPLSLLSSLRQGRGRYQNIGLLPPEPGTTEGTKNKIFGPPGFPHDSGWDPHRGCRLRLLSRFDTERMGGWVLNKTFKVWSPAQTICF